MLSTSRYCGETFGVWCSDVKLAFHGADTDTDTGTDILATILARMSVSVLRRGMPA